MTNLTDLIEVIPPDRDDTPEDIFASATSTIFTDDLQNLHGDPDSTIVYKSKVFGNIELKTADPQVEGERRLFSHYLWNAGIKLSELISPEENSQWHLRDERVLELGAGVGLPSIVATLSGAQEVVISDYPSTRVIENLRQNTKAAIPASLESKYCIEGHEWGILDSIFAKRYAHHFTRILAADCYWMSSQHVNLVRSMLHFLTFQPDGRVFAISGFHTGRATLAVFFEVAEMEGLEVEEIYEEDANGVRRAWLSERDGGIEDHIERKRWLVIARLRRRQPS